jgi:hypothetical protein
MRTCIADYPKRRAAFASASSASSARSPRDPLPRIALTVLTVFSALVLTLIILVPVRPSRENVISMPKVRRNVCARRSRPASARGFFAHAGPPEMSSRALSAHKRRSSDALPVHMVRLAMIARTQLAMGSASMMLSTAARRFAA